MEFEDKGILLNKVVRDYLDLILVETVSLSAKYQTTTLGKDTRLRLCEELHK